MTNYTEAVRKLARAVADDGTELTIALFGVYLVAAGAEVRGPWAYIPGCPKAIKGRVAAAQYVLSLPDTSTFLRHLANAMDAHDREVGRHEPAPLAQTPVYASDMTPLAARADDLNAIARQVSDLASAIAATPPPAAPAPDPHEVHIGDDVDLADLTAAQGKLVQRVVRRAAYDTGKTLLDVLDGWIEGGRENHEALEHRGESDPCWETFHASDIRRMVNDAMRAMGAPEHPLTQPGER